MRWTCSISLAAHRAAEAEPLSGNVVSKVDVSVDL
jgi:hypothetical protein